MLLLSKHHRIIKIENNTPICPLQEAKLQLIETNCLKQNHDVVPGRFLQDAKAIAQTRATCGQHGRFDSKALILLKTIAQTQPRARRITVFDDAEDLHL